VFQRAVVVTINTVVVSVIFEPVVNIASKTPKSRILHLLISFWRLLPLFRWLLHADPKTMTVCLSLTFACLGMRTYSYAFVTFTNTLSRRRLRLMCVCLSFFGPIICAKAQLPVTIRPPSSTKPDSDTGAPNETLRTYSEDYITAYLTHRRKFSRRRIRVRARVRVKVSD